MNNFIKRHKLFILSLFFVLLWMLTLVFTSPEEIVKFIGVEGGYFFLFITALIGVSGFASAPFYVMLATFTYTGEFNIFLVAAIVAPARALGDALFFFLGYGGHSVLSEWMGKHMKNFSFWLQNKPPWAVPLVAYLYTSFTPFPQDILMVTLGVGKAFFLHVILAVILGNATFVMLFYLFYNFLF